MIISGHPCWWGAGRCPCCSPRCVQTAVQAYLMRTWLAAARLCAVGLLANGTRDVCACIIFQCPYSFLNNETGVHVCEEDVTRKVWSRALSHFLCSADRPRTLFLVFLVHLALCCTFDGHLLCCIFSRVNLMRCGPFEHQTCPPPSPISTASQGIAPGTYLGGYAKFQVERRRLAFPYSSKTKRSRAEL